MRFIPFRVLFSADNRRQLIIVGFSFSQHRIRRHRGRYLVPPAERHSVAAQAHQRRPHHPAQLRDVGGVGDPAWRTDAVLDVRPFLSTIAPDF